MRTGTLVLWLTFSAAVGRAEPADAWIAQGISAEGRLDSRAALDSFLAAAAARPDDPVILQKIARQYSDLADDQPTTPAKKDYAQRPLSYAEQAVRLAPNNPVNVLSLAISHGKLALGSDPRARIGYARLVEAEAERALALDPNYAWAHHVLGC